MNELKGNDSQKQKSLPSLARMCISVINLYLPVMAVTEFQAFGAGR